MQPRTAPAATYTCEICSRPLTELEAVTCDACSIERIESLLDSPSWVRVRGSTPGDRPGQTLADTMRAELVRLRSRLSARVALATVTLCTEGVRLVGGAR